QPEAVAGWSGSEESDHQMRPEEGKNGASRAASAAFVSLARRIRRASSRQGGRDADRLRGLRRRGRLPLQATDSRGPRLGRRVRVAGALRRRGRPGLSRYVKQPRPEPIDENWLVLVILLGPLAYVARWIWRRLKELSA